MTQIELYLILATLSAPILAIQAQKFIERATARRDARRRIFSTLMATRAHPMRTHPDHVQALNMIDLEFGRFGWLGYLTRDAAREREVKERWRSYAAHLNLQVDEQNAAAVFAWNMKADDLFVDLLVAIAAALRYQFDRTQIQHGVYYPKAHNEAAIRQRAMESVLFDVLVGNQPLSMRITEFPFQEPPPSPPEALKDGRRIWCSKAGRSAVRAHASSSNEDARIEHEPA